MRKHAGLKRANRAAKISKSSYWEIQQVSKKIDAALKQCVKRNYTFCLVFTILWRSHVRIISQKR